VKPDIEEPDATPVGSHRRRAYASAFHQRFIGLRADRVTTEATTKAFKVFCRKMPTGSSYTIDHTATSYVFEPTGQLRLAIRHEQDAASVTTDITQILKEQP